MLCDISVASGTHIRENMSWSSTADSTFEFYNMYLTNRVRTFHVCRLMIMYFVCNRSADKLLGVRKYSQIGHRYRSAVITIRSNTLEIVLISRACLYGPDACKVFTLKTLHGFTIEP